MRRQAICLLLAIPATAHAGPAVVVSQATDSVAVTIYRDPNRGDQPIYLRAPNAFALVAETRTVTLPPGEVVVRFEGVASGIVPQSAILFGAEPRERNRDAALLSQRGLVDAFTGQQVTLRRTDPATGKVTEQRATVRSAADRLVVATEGGVEAVYCSGLMQTLIYPNAPVALSAKPVLSMTTRDQPGGTVTITLAYIATGFDWNANYVATLTPDGREFELLGWLTLVSADETSFPDATASAVAGRVNRSNNTRDDIARIAIQQARSLNKFSSCWPADTTSSVTDDGYPPPPPPAPPPPPPMAMAMDNIVVTAQRRSESVKLAVTAQAEGLGDLKLYRIPVPVTVAAQSQKQVAFIAKERVRGTIVYRSRVGSSPAEPRMLVRFRNRKQDGLGEPLPAGKAILYQESAFGRLFVGETATPDKAIDEEVELTFGPAANVTLETKVESLKAKRGNARKYLATIRNANPFPVRFELEFPLVGDSIYRPPAGKLIAKPGKRVWSATIPANGTVRTQYTSMEGDD
jgi:hypothetical protein